jgi:hypothetical protein
MHYLRVQWLHSFPGDPVDIYSEVDDEGWETRKVEIFPDGSIGYASATDATRSTVLSEERVPAVETIAADPQFRPERIGKDQFERVWAKRLSSAQSA